MLVIPKDQNINYTKLKYVMFYDRHNAHNQLLINRFWNVSEVNIPKSYFEKSSSL